MVAADFTHEIISLRPILKGFTHRFTSDRDESLDLVQDTIMKALMNKERFSEDTNLKGWLFTIMRNTFINKYRKNQRHKTTYDTTQDLFHLNVADSHTFNSPQSNFEYKDICKTIDELKEEFQIPFKMHISGYKYHEISAHLDIPIGTVKNRIFHARKEIQKKLAGY